MRSPRDRGEVENGQGPQIKPWGIPTISGQRDEKESAEETEAWLVMGEEHQGSGSILDLRYPICKMWVLTCSEVLGFYYCIFVIPKHHL